MEQQAIQQEQTRQQAIKEEQTRQQVIQQEQARQRDSEMGIENCKEGTKQLIRAYLSEIGKTKIHPLDQKQIGALKDRVKPKCPKGHEFYSEAADGAYKCDSGRSGDRCLKQHAHTLFCYNKGCSGSDPIHGKNCFFMCQMCAYWGQ